MKIQRNDPCTCGSGKKFKNCCAAEPGKTHWLATLSVCLFIVITGVVVASVIRDVKSGPTIPDGFVWNEEHGHLHREGGDPHAAPGALPPVGSDWSDEHQHYHGPDGRQITWSDAQSVWLDADGKPVL
jgi:hypothetical protein